MSISLTIFSGANEKTVR